MLNQGRTPMSGWFEQKTRPLKNGKTKTNDTKIGKTSNDNMNGQVEIATPSTAQKKDIKKMKIDFL